MVIKISKEIKETKEQIEAYNQEVYGKPNPSLSEIYKIENYYIQFHSRKMNLPASRIINIFDIDGTIIPNLFTNVKEFTKQEKKQFIKQQKQVKLFPYFIKYYEVINELYKCYNIFLTGRKRKEYQKLTYKLLYPLQDIEYFQIIFYPESLLHIKESYYNFKILKTFEIIKFIINKCHFQYNEIKVQIFDDMIEWTYKFDSLLNIINLSIYPIQNERKWYDLYRMHLIQF